MEITITNLQKKLPVSIAKTKRLLLKILSREGIKKRGEIGILFVDNKTIQRLNLKFAKVNSATDVLAFNLSENKRGKPSWQIVVSADMAQHNATLFKTTPSFELYLYVVHGLLHLLGYNDLTTRQRELMNRLACQYTRQRP